MYKRNPKMKKKKEAKDNKFSFGKIMKEVGDFSNTYTTWREKKAMENKKVEALGGKAQKKQRLPLSVARVQMKKQKEREEKIFEQNQLLGKYGGLLGGVSTKKPVEKKRKPEDRVLKSMVGNFKSGVLDVRHMLHNGSSRIERDKNVSYIGRIKLGGEGSVKSKGGKKKKGKKGKGKKKGGGKKKGKK